MSLFQHSIKTMPYDNSSYINLHLCVKALWYVRCVCFVNSVCRLTVCVSVCLCVGLCGVFDHPSDCLISMSNEYL